MMNNNQKFPIEPGTAVAITEIYITYHISWSLNVDELQDKTWVACYVGAFYKDKDCYEHLFCDGMTFKSVITQSPIIYANTRVNIYSISSKEKIEASISFL